MLSRTDLDLLMTQAKDAFLNRRHEQVVEFTTELLKHDARRLSAYLLRAEALRKQRLSDRALADLAVAIRLDPNQAQPYVIRAEILKKQNRLDQAIADTTQAILLNPNLAAAYAIRGECRRLIGDVEGARQDADELFRLDPTRPMGRASQEPQDAPSHRFMTEEDTLKLGVPSRAGDSNDLFADRKPVDRSMNLRRGFGSEDVDPLAEAADYRPEFLTRPLPRSGARRRHDAVGPLLVFGVILGVGACVGYLMQPNRTVDPQVNMRSQAGSMRPIETNPSPSNSSPATVPVPDQSASGRLAQQVLPAPETGSSPEDNETLGVIFDVSRQHAGTGSHQLVEVAELNEEGDNSVYWVSPDGLTIYWVRAFEGLANEMIWTAERRTLNSPFENKTELFTGSSVTVSPDQLEMIFYGVRSDGQKDFSLYVSTRSSKNDSWGRPREIRELARYYSSGPCLSPDGLELYFSVRPKPAMWGTVSIVRSTRRDRSSSWGAPEEVRNIVGQDGVLRFPSIAADGLTLLCGNNFTDATDSRPNILIWTRPDTTADWGPADLLQPPGLPPLRCSMGCNYVPGTQELFFARSMPSGYGIWVVKNFKLPIISEDVTNPPNVSLATAEPTTVLSDLRDWALTGASDPPNWIMQDGVLTYAAQGPSLMTQQSFQNFDLHLDYLLPSHANSGVFLRGRFEIQLIDPGTSLPNGRALSPIQQNGAIYGVIPPRQVVFRGVNQWNTLDVRIVGRAVTVRMNGSLVIDKSVLDQVTAGALVNLLEGAGPIVLQGHAVTGVRFRNIQITPLPD